MDNVIDPNNGNLVYGFIQFGQILNFSTNSGQTIGLIGAPTDVNGAAIQGEWITPLAISSEGDVYAGYKSVYKFIGNAWERISGNIASDEIDDLEIDPNDPMIIYVAEGSILYRIVRMPSLVNNGKECLVRR